MGHFARWQLWLVVFVASCVGCCIFVVESGSEKERKKEINSVGCDVKNVR